MAYAWLKQILTDKKYTTKLLLEKIELISVKGFKIYIKNAKKRNFDWNLKHFYLICTKVVDASLLYLPSLDLSSTYCLPFSMSAFNMK